MIYMMLMFAAAIAVWQHMRMLHTGKRVIQGIGARTSYAMYAIGCATAIIATCICEDVIGRAAAIVLAASLVTRVAAPIMFEKIIPNAGETIQLATLFVFFNGSRMGYVLACAAVLWHAGKIIY